MSVTISYGSRTSTSRHQHGPMQIEVPVEVVTPEITDIITDAKTTYIRTHALQRAAYGAKCARAMSSEHQWVFPLAEHCSPKSRGTFLDASLRSLRNIGSPPGSQLRSSWSAQDHSVISEQEIVVDFEMLEHTQAALHTLKDAVHAEFGKVAVDETVLPPKTVIDDAFDSSIELQPRLLSEHLRVEAAFVSAAITSNTIEECSEDLSDKHEQTLECEDNGLSLNFMLEHPSAGLETIFEDAASEVETAVAEVAERSVLDEDGSDCLVAIEPDITIVTPLDQLVEVCLHVDEEHVKSCQAADAHIHLPEHLRAEAAFAHVSIASIGEAFRSIEDDDCNVEVEARESVASLQERLAASLDRALFAGELVILTNVSSAPVPSSLPVHERSPRSRATENVGMLAHEQHRSQAESQESGCWLRQYVSSHDGKVPNSTQLRHFVTNRGGKLSYKEAAAMIEDFQFEISGQACLVDSFARPEATDTFLGDSEVSRPGLQMSIVDATQVEGAGEEGTSGYCMFLDCTGEDLRVYEHDQ